MDTQAQAMLIANSWSSMLRSAQNHASSMSTRCSPVAVGLINTEVRKFGSQDVPITQDELSIRRTQSMELSSRIAAVAHAETRARMHPNIATSIFDAVRDYLNAPYPTTSAISTDGSTRQSVLSSTISRLCDSDLNSRIRNAMASR